MFVVKQYNEAGNLETKGTTKVLREASDMCRELEKAWPEDAMYGAAIWYETGSGRFGDAHGCFLSEDYRDESAGSVLTGREF